MASDSAKSRSNIYETITAKILAAIEANPGEPVLPWQRGGFNPTLPINATTQAACLSPLIRRWCRKRSEINTEASRVPSRGKISQRIVLYALSWFQPDQRG